MPAWMGFVFFDNGTGLNPFLNIFFIPLCFQTDAVRLPGASNKSESWWESSTLSAGRSSYTTQIWRLDPPLQLSGRGDGSPLMISCLIQIPGLCFSFCLKALRWKEGWWGERKGGEVNDADEVRLESDNKRRVVGSTGTSSVLCLALCSLSRHAAGYFRHMHTLSHTQNKTEISMTIVLQPVGITKQGWPERTAAWQSLEESSVPLRAINTNNLQSDFRAKLGVVVVYNWVSVVSRGMTYVVFIDVSWIKFSRFSAGWSDYYLGARNFRNYFNLFCSFSSVSIKYCGTLKRKQFKKFHWHIYQTYWKCSDLQYWLPYIQNFGISLRHAGVQLLDQNLIKIEPVLLYLLMIVCHFLVVYLLFEDLPVLSRIKIWGMYFFAINPKFQCHICRCPDGLVYWCVPQLQR